MFKIEKGIPIPTTKKGRRGEIATQLRTALVQMNVGDSIGFSEEAMTRAYAFRVIAQFIKNSGMVFTIRQTEVEGTYRIWRTA